MRAIYLIFLSFFLLSLKAQDSLALKTDTIKPSLEPIFLTARDSVVDFAFQFKGVPYKMGGLSHSGMDCSGLVCNSFKVIDLQLPHSSGALAAYGEYVEVDSLQKGDLVFFKGRSLKDNVVGHVAIVSKVVDGNIYLVHATSSRGVIEEILQKNSYFMDRWLFNKRVIPD